MAEYFSPRAPESIPVKGGEQALVSRRRSDTMYTALYITNNSDNNVYLGFTGSNADTGNASPNHGITIFPKTVMEFTDPIILGCAVWATCDDGKEAVIGVQQ